MTFSPKSLSRDEPPTPPGKITSISWIGVSAQWQGRIFVGSYFYWLTSVRMRTMFPWTYCSAELGAHTNATAWMRMWERMRTTTVTRHSVATRRELTGTGTGNLLVECSCVRTFGVRGWSGDEWVLLIHKIRMILPISQNELVQLSGLSGLLEVRVHMGAV